MKKISLSLLFSIMSTMFFGQEIKFETTIDASAYVSEDDTLPFWFYTNRTGTINPDTNVFTQIGSTATYEKNKYLNFEVGGTFFFNDTRQNVITRNQLYIIYSNPFLKATIGAKNNDEVFDGLSSSNQNFLQSRNARAIPGVLLETNKDIPLFKNISMDIAIGHYELNDDRFIDETNIHHKKLGLNYKISATKKLYISLQHYALWGGVSEEIGALSTTAEDLLNIFVAKQTGNLENALGNHLGSYFIKYEFSNKLGDFQLYHDHPFEDGSGTRFANFPDGIWGVTLKPNSEMITSILYEYIDSSDQSGAIGRSGRDSYFRHGFYESGWTYEANIIGLPFISLSNTRIKAHQIGAKAIKNNIEIIGKASYVRDLGTFFTPLEPNQIRLLTSLETTYKLEKAGNINLLLGYDYLKQGKDTYGASLGYSYSF